METILFGSKNNKMFDELVRLTGIEPGNSEWHNFPDGESLVRINSDVKGKRVFLCCSLNNPDEKFLPVCFFAKTCRDLGSKKISLIAPYLPYLRQDKIFHRGEGLTSAYFAEFLSSVFDELITVDPHLHRWKKLEDLYSLNCITLHSENIISRFITNKINNPVLIGPDSESRQWVDSIAERCGIPSLVLKKVRSGDNEVEISIPDLEKYREHTPVIVDDIISSGTTILKAASNILSGKLQEVNCIAIHAVFNEETYRKMLTSIKNIWTTNSIFHSSNSIDIVPLIAEELKKTTG